MAVVVERSNTLIHLIISSLELKFEGSNPGHAKTSFHYVHARARMFNFAN